MKEARKTPNIHIRNSSRHSSHRPESTKLKSIPNLNQEKVKQKKNKAQPTVDLRKQFLEVENLTQQEQALIRKEAQKNAAKKMKNTELKIEKDMISMLESELIKLGVEVEKEKVQNRNLKFENAELMKKVDYLNRKIEKMFEDKEILSKNSNYEQLEKGQLKEELTKLRLAYQELYKEKETEVNKCENQIRSLKDEMLKYINKSNDFQEKVESLMTEKGQQAEALKEKIAECQNLREIFEKKKQEWDQKQLKIEESAKNHLDKKGEKIAKYQIQIHQVNEKFKEEEYIRKKTTDKNQELQKELSKKIEIIGDMEDQICNLKKRVNDLSILKSSNNMIMTQKLQIISDENSKLKKTIQLLKKKGLVPEESNTKPLLFGPQDQD